MKGELSFNRKIHQTKINKTDSILKQAFDPINSVITIVNLELFVILMVLWFWYIGSQQLYSVIDSNVKDINNIVENSPALDLSLQVFIETTKNDTELINQAKIDVEEKNKQNIKLFRIYFLPIILSLFFLLIILIIRLYRSKCKWGGREWLLVVLMILAFVTEIIFYFIVIKGFHYISPVTILYKIMEN